MSPPIATELVKYFEEGAEHISDIVLIATSDLKVQESCELVRTALAIKYPKVNTHTIALPFSDILSTEDNIEFMRVCARAIKTEREVHKCEKIYLNIAGGRKDMSVSISLLGQLLDVDGIFHIISAGVDVINVPLERIKKEIGDLSQATDKLEFYKANRDKFDEIMFPSLETFKVIQIPCIPFPQEYLGNIITLLKSETIVPNEEITISNKELKRLQQAGLLLIREDGIYRTEFGKQLASLFGK